MNRRRLGCGHNHGLKGKIVVPAIVVLTALVCCGGTVWAQSIDAQARRLADEVITAVHERLLSLKPRRKELEGYTDAVLSVDRTGFKRIEYEIRLPTAAGDVTYGFGLTAAALETLHPFEKKPGAFSFVFPYLKLKLVGYLIKHPLQQHLDIVPIVRDESRRLGEYEQRFLPLQLRLIPEKTQLAINEPVRFTVELKNNSGTHMRVKRLGPETLVFMHGDAVWGVVRQENESAQKDDDPWVILKARQSLRLKLKGEGFSTAKPVVIYGIYRMGIGGVRPTAKMTLEIVRP